MEVKNLGYYQMLLLDYPISCPLYTHGSWILYCLGLPQTVNALPELCGLTSSPAL